MWLSVRLCESCRVDLVSSAVGSSGGQTEADVQADAGAAAAGGEVPPSHRRRARQREEQTRRLHEQERRLHQPAGAGEGEVSAGRPRPVLIV